MGTGPLNERDVSRVHAQNGTACERLNPYKLFEYKGKVPRHLNLSQANKILGVEV